MQPFSKQILEGYQVRKTKAQKTRFIELIQQEFKDRDVKVETGGIFKSRNIIVGDLENCQYVLCAHYDTAPVLPFPNFLAPKNIFVYLLYCLALVMLFFVVALVVSLITALFTDSVKIMMFVDYVVCLGFIMHMFIGKANKYTANDNTSGVITLNEALHDEKIKNQVCCVFFDHEEVGLFGSSYFSKQHKDVLKDKLLFNFDCVSDGDTIMLIYSNQAKPQKGKLEECFMSDLPKNFLVTSAKRTLYPSDQMNFKNYVGVAAFKRNKWIGYYMDRIHTNKDVIFEEKNIEMIIQGLRNFVSEDK